MGRNGAITGSRCEGRPGWVHGVASSTQPGALPLGTAERHAQRTPIQAAVRGLSYMGFDYEIRGGPSEANAPRAPTDRPENVSAGSERSICPSERSGSAGHLGGMARICQNPASMRQQSFNFRNVP